jgi:hypothetical protein
MTKSTKLDEKAEMIKTLRRIAEELGTTSVSWPDFHKRSRVTRHRVVRLFGSYNELVEAAGLVRRQFPGTGARRYSKEEEIAEIVRVLRMPNSKLTTTFFHENSKMSLCRCLRRFGGWFNVLKLAARKLEREKDRGLRWRILVYTARHSDACPDTQEAVDGTLLSPQTPYEHLALQAAACEMPLVSENCYGDLIRFRGLEHAPINEQGVMLLFGMICRDLGYVVEKVKSGFPDCEAKRQVRPGVWQRVRIEFEFRSRMFQRHRHDPRKCDLIVCWENNWPDCPIEVQELKSLLRRLSS